MHPKSNALLDIFERLSTTVSDLRFGEPVAHVYNPLEYARANYLDYIDRYALPRRTESPRVLFLGMNPGPWGMAQTGIPFGSISNVRDWLGFRGAISERPANEHPKRPVLGLDCGREEVSGQRFWGWAEARWETPERFFRSFFVLNYCPLLFLDAGGRNLTPDKIRADERRPLLDACDTALVEFVDLVAPDRIVGIGVFAEQCAERIAPRLSLERQPSISRILHPSPASPAANRGWSEAATKQLRAQGIAVPGA